MSDNSKSRFFPDPQPPTQEEDIYQLQAWVDNLCDYLTNGGSPNQTTAMIFRPHTLGWDALMRLGAKFPVVIQQVTSFLDNVEKCFTEFSDDCYENNKQSSEDFHWSMVELSMRIRTAIETINNTAEPIQNNADPDPNQMVSPTNIAIKYGFDEKQKDRLRHSLKAWRKPDNIGEWIEIQDRGPRQPGYLYRLGSIKHLIDKIKASS